MTGGGEKPGEPNGTSSDDHTEHAEKNNSDETGETAQVPPRQTPAAASTSGASTPVSPSQGQTPVVPTQGSGNVGSAVERKTEVLHASNERNSKFAEDMTASKDRFMLGSATGTSLLNLTVLSDVLQDGSEYSMYVPLLILISVAIGLQIVIGLISLLVGNMKTYFNAFKKKRKRDCTLSDVEGLTYLKIYVEDDNGNLIGKPASEMKFYKQKKNELASRALPACRVQKIKSEEAATVAEKNIEILEKAKKGAETPKDEKEAKTYSDVLAEQKLLIKQFEVDKERFELLQKEDEAKEEGRYLRRKVFWQNIVNYIAYFVVVLNAFIVALKPLSEKNDDAPLIGTNASI